MEFRQKCTLLNSLELVNDRRRWMLTSKVKRCNFTGRPQTSLKIFPKQKLKTYFQSEINLGSPKDGSFRMLWEWENKNKEADRKTTCNQNITTSSDYHHCSIWLEIIWTYCPLRSAQYERSWSWTKHTVVTVKNLFWSYTV